MKTSDKVFWIAWLALLLFIVGLYIGSKTTCGADLSVSYGSEISWSSSLSEDLIKHSSLEIDIPVKDNFLLGLDGSLVLEHISTDADERHSPVSPSALTTSDALSISWRARLPIITTEKIALSFFGRLGWMGKHLPEIGKSGVLGHFGGEINLVVAPSAGLRFALSHISDPLQSGDSGHERQYIGFYWRF